MDEKRRRELDAELAAAKGALLRRQQLARRLEGARRSLEEQRAQHDRLGQRLEQEALDVERLEGRSLTAIFRTILGDKESQLEEERQEYLAAKLRYDATDVAVATLEEEVADLEGLLAELGDPRGQYESLLAEKEQLVLETGDERGRHLLALSGVWAGAQADVRELEEALEAGQQVLSGLREVQSQLKSAENWGVWDMVGGGLIATAVKRSHMDEARQRIHEVQQQLERFGRELADVDAEAVAALEPDSFETFADYFFDGLIMDWIVQSRIQNSLQAVEDTRRQVSTVVDDLEGALVKARGQADRVAQERRQVVESA